MMKASSSNSDRPEQSQLTNAEESPEVKIGKKLVATLDGLVKSGDWSSLFLRTLKGRIQAIIDDTNALIVHKGREDVVSNAEQSKFKQLTPKGYVRIYVLLYQTEGNKLSSWQKTIKMLVEYNTSRPTYRDEDYIQELIRSKKDIERYGYAAVNVEEGAIYSQTTSVLRDQFDHEMIALKDNSIKAEQIVGFVHANKKRYDLVDWQLVYQSDVE